MKPYIARNAFYGVPGDRSTHETAAVSTVREMVVGLLGSYSKLAEHFKRMKRTATLVAQLAVDQPRRPTAAPFVHKVSQRFDPAVLEQLVAEYRTGTSTLTLMASYGLGKGTVLGILERAGVELRGQGLREEDLARVASLYRHDGWSLKQLGTEFRCDAETVRQALKRAGVEMRKPWERPAPAAPVD